jgi:hypothetical protein
MRALGEDKFPPLTVAEHPEMIALGERIARYYQHPSQVHLATEYRRRQLRSVPVGDVVAAGETPLVCAKTGWELPTGQVNEVRQGTDGSISLRPG